MDTILPSGSPTIQEASLTPLETRIVQTLVYADVFDYALTALEIHRYLIGVGAAGHEVEHALNGGRLIPRYVERHGDFYTLPGRSAAAAIRRRRQAVAACLWPDALRYARLIARLPFVRMVAVTGALAVDNVEPQSDIDLLIVTQPGRLWLCRALVIAVVKLARRRGDVICPNYFLSERVLALRERNLFTAHEFAQMVPLAGQMVYQHMLALNRWVDGILPNTNGAAARFDIAPVHGYWAKSLLEGLLNTPPGRWLERWEMERKIRKFSQHPASEAAFNEDCCKGHFDLHGQRILGAYQDRLGGQR